MPRLPTGLTALGAHPLRPLLALGAGESCDGGADEFDESWPNRASSSAIRARAAANSALNPTTNAASSSYEGSPTSASDTPQMIDNHQGQDQPHTPSVIKLLPNDPAQPNP